MKTDDLIRGLAADARPEKSLEAGLALALMAGVVAAALLFALILAPRPGMPGALTQPRILLKFAVTLSLAAGCARLALRLARPGADARHAGWSLMAPAAILAMGVAAELVASPAASWMPGLVGHNAIYCLTLIPLIAAPVLVAALAGLRRGAPEHPRLAGAAAGALAGGLGAALYALHCVDDSPLFVLAWYSLAIGMVALAGALVGRSALSW